MTYSEEKGNLFSANKKYHLCHCIASDARMGAGIAVKFVENYPYIKSLRKTINNVGTCIKIKRVLNLITKKVSNGRPTYQSLEKSLIDCKNICIKENIKFIAMPKIGCGLDGLQWENVREMIKIIFNNVDIEIKVYKL
jgi:O-acetyl-ADP-ribose deacetylase (regulator of RNase III)